MESEPAARKLQRASWDRGWSTRCCRHARIVQREQWTEIDRALQRSADGNRVVSYEHFQPRGEAPRTRAQQEIDRLQFLEQLGLAQRIDERSWQLSENHERELRDRQQSNDIIKTRARERQRQKGAERELER